MKNYLEPVNFHDHSLGFLSFRSTRVFFAPVRFGEYAVTMQTQNSPLSKTILIVEDNELNMTLWNDVLEAQGYALLKTSFGLEAVEIARNHRPDLILLDIRLPDISGFDVARTLKADEATQSIPVIALTAFAQAEHQREALASGCDGYISKPVNVVNFLETVAGWLGG